jgi:hypothetical protein
MRLEEFGLKNCLLVCLYELEKQCIVHSEEYIDCAACEAEWPMEAICADADVRTQFQSEIKFNAVQSKRLKDEGQQAIMQTKPPLAALRWSLALEL